MKKIVVLLCLVYVGLFSITTNKFDLNSVEKDMVAVIKDSSNYRIITIKDSVVTKVIMLYNLNKQVVNVKVYINGELKETFNNKKGDVRFKNIP